MKRIFITLLFTMTLLVLPCGHSVDANQSGSNASRLANKEQANKEQAGKGKAGKETDAREQAAKEQASIESTPSHNLSLATLRRDFKNSFPIPAGEKLEYEIKYSRFPIYASVGVVTFENLGAVANQ